MKTNSQSKKIHCGAALPHFRIAAAGVCVLAAAALAGIAANPNPPKLPWKVPTVNVGNNPVFDVVDQATNTIYVANVADDTVSVIDGSRCNSSNSSRCSPIATLTVGQNPLFMAFNPTTGTLYVTITGGTENTIAVVNANTCNARNTSGCGQTRAVVTVPGATFNDDLEQASNIVLDTASHTLYVGDANEGPISFLDTATCNGTNRSGCGQALVTTATNGDSLTIDHTNHSVYVTVLADGTFSVFDAATCNAVDTSGCSQTAGPFTSAGSDVPGIVDESTHTLYLAEFGSGGLDHVAMINGVTCNGIDTSGCGNPPPTVQVGNQPFTPVLDPTTRTVFVPNQNSATVSVINAATCNATNQSGCGPIPLPALAQGTSGGFLDINPNTHTLYATSQDLNNVWVLGTSNCNGTNTAGCTKFEPTTTVGITPVGIVESATTRTLYVSNQGEGTVSVIDTRVCNRRQLSGCNQSWPTINLGVQPRFEAINNVTNTLYIANFNDHPAPGWISVINAATCNNQNTSNCAELATIPVGIDPQQIVVDEATNTIYLVNQLDSTMSVISGVNCNANDVSGCNQPWPTVAVGSRPQGLGFNPINHTLYVTNTNDDTVSVISTYHCNGTDTSGCTPVATVPVGAAPRAVGIVNATNSVFIGNRDDLTVSVFDGSTCNGSNTSGCPQVPPPAVLLGAFPSIAGNGNNILGRSIVFDATKQTLLIPIPGDDDVATLDTSVCRAGRVNSCQVNIVPKRMGGFAVTAAVDSATDTVYVVNDDDGTVSLFGQ